ncbi:hypothetical protein [Streptomyces himastatinicus]|nr:hypothetical protein [Streptomyces himastatinicus]
MPEPRYDARTITNLAAERARRRAHTVPDEPRSEIVDLGGGPLEMRTVHGSDGTIGTLGCTPGAFDHLTDDEVIAMMREALKDEPDGP